MILRSYQIIFALLIFQELLNAADSNSEEDEEDRELAQPPAKKARDEKTKPIESKKKQVKFAVDIVPGSKEAAEKEHKDNEESEDEEEEMEVEKDEDSDDNSDDQDGTSK